MPGSTALMYAVRPSVVAKYTGQLCLLVAAVTVVPLVFALVVQEYTFAWRFAAIMAVLAVFAIPGFLVPAPIQLQFNEALSIIAVVFVIACGVNTFPLTAAGLDWDDAFFEAVSAITTTGLTTVTGLEDRPVTFLFTRAWIQWYSGLGFIVLFVALMTGHHLAAKRLAEPIGQENFLTTSRSHARRMLVIYGLLTLTALLACWLVIGDAFVTLTHVLSAVSTAGFSMYDTNLAALDSWAARHSLIFFALLGAVPFPLFYVLWQSGWRHMVKDGELHALIIAVIAGCLILWSLMMWQQHWSWDKALAHALNLGISAQSSTGFSSTEVASLSEAAKLSLIGQMFIGGGAWSTAGGIKLLRLLILLRVLQLVLRRLLMPTHAVVSPKLGERSLEEEGIQRALTLAMLYIAVIFVSWFVFMLYGINPSDALFDVVSAAGTVGLSTGVTRTDLPSVLKLVLCADMLLGRLEIVAFIIVFYPRTWIGKRVD